MLYTAFLNYLTAYLSNYRPEELEPYLKSKDSSDCVPCRNIKFDFIIVGAGTAGCVVANRLTKNPNWKVLLIEAGGDEDYITDVPGLRSQLLVSSYTWNYTTVEQSRNCLGSKGVCIYPGGLVMGGSSTIGGMTFFRGKKEDFNLWEELGNPEWNYTSVFPYFLRMENVTSSVLLKSPYRSSGGPQSVGFTKFNLSIFQDLIKAGQEYGLEHLVDYNGEKLEGVAYTQFTVRDATRCSTSKAYLNPVKDRKNLFIFKNTLVTGLVFSEEEPRVIGVTCVTNGTQYNVTASKEVILSAGVINTPKLLMLSGVGPREHLEELDIPVVVDLPVGEHLVDHNELFMFFQIDGNNLEECKAYSEETIVDYVKYRQGILTSTPSQVIANIMQTINDSLVGEIELLFGADCGEFDPNREKRIKVLVGNRNPKSTGRVRLSSKDYDAVPLIDPNYYAEQVDLDIMAWAMKQTLKYMQQSSLSKYHPKWIPVDTPQCGIANDTTSTINITDSLLECYIKYNGNPGLHPVGTARMGNNQKVEMSVVNSKLLVHNICNLRIVDASIMPTITRTPTAAPVIMIAEKASDYIIADHCSP